MGSNFATLTVCDTMKFLMIWHNSLAGQGDIILADFRSLKQWDLVCNFGTILWWWLDTTSQDDVHRTTFLRHILLTQTDCNELMSSLVIWFRAAVGSELEQVFTMTLTQLWFGFGLIQGWVLDSDLQTGTGLGCSDWNCRLQVSRAGLDDWFDYWLRFGTADCSVWGQILRKQFWKINRSGLYQLFNYPSFLCSPDTWLCSQK